MVMQCEKVPQEYLYATSTTMHLHYMATSLWTPEYHTHVLMFPFMDSSHAACARRTLPSTVAKDTCPGISAVFSMVEKASGFDWTSLHMHRCLTRHQCSTFRLLVKDINGCSHTYSWHEALADCLFTQAFIPMFNFYSSLTFLFSWFLIFLPAFDILSVPR